MDNETFNKIIGTIKCAEIEDLPNGDCKVIFEYTKEFKESYKEAFKLKRFSRRHFEKTLDEAIRNYCNKLKNDCIPEE